MKQITSKRKYQEGRGKGTGAKYKPWIQTREFNSLGTCSTPIDWKTGRTMQFLSQGEAMLWHILRWNDDVVDIREQYPLDLETTLKIADTHNIKHPNNRTSPMTTDLLVTYKDGSEKAYSVKTNRRAVERQRTKEKLFIEKYYWDTYCHSEYQIVFKDEINVVLAENIRSVMVFYDPSTVFDDMSLMKHMIAHKIIIVDMETKPLVFRDLLVKYRPLICDKGDESHDKC